MDSMTQTKNLKFSAMAANLAIMLAFASIIALASLHVASPEFDPSWRMVSEYATGEFEWMLFVFFTTWGLSTWCVCYVVWGRATSWAARVGILLLFISGLGEILAAFFNVNHPQHGTAGALGVPPFVVAALLVSYHLRTKPEWADGRRWLLSTAHAAWISLVLLVVTMVVMIAGFSKAGIPMGQGQVPPTEVPDGVIAIIGYVNRLLIAVFVGWLLLVARRYGTLLKSNSQA